ncbi:hypothetical protein Adt_37842 [Abeliophyllum distichum]|uniref:Uncharacterized protein n=1 Tax=Abeliophyllum distichum TaxID=126358 RepID=A0ABD1Q4L0_9LAMI
MDDSTHGPDPSPKPPDAATKVLGHLPPTIPHTIAGHTPPHSSSIEPQKPPTAADLRKNLGSAAGLKGTHTGRTAQYFFSSLGRPQPCIGHRSKHPCCCCDGFHFVRTRDGRSIDKIPVDNATIRPSQAASEMRDSRARGGHALIPGMLRVTPAFSGSL